MDEHRVRAVNTGSMRPSAGLLLAITGVLPFCGGLAFLLCTTDVDVTPLRMAGSAAAAVRVLGDRADAFRDAVHADHVFVAGCTITLVWVFLLARRTLARHVNQQHLAVTGAVAALVAGLCAVAGNLLLAHGIPRAAQGANLPFALATGCATVTWVLLALTGPVAVVLVAITVKRAASHAVPFLRRRTGPAPAGDDVIPPWPVVRADGARWPRSARPDPPAGSAVRWLNGSRVPPGREQGALGFCVSGGGIRSACVTLGALQVLRDDVRKARYLVSVSGGGYLAGALQLALTGPLEGGALTPARAAPADVFGPGTPEEDHLRRHSKYLAEGTGQWLTALGVLLRGLLASLSLLVAGLLVLGLALSWAYHRVPVTDLTCLAGSAPPCRPGFRTPAVAAILCCLGAALACWLVWLVTFAWLPGSRRPPLWAATAFRLLVVLALFLVLVVLLLPAVAWGAMWLKHWTDVGVRGVGAGAGLTALLTYVAVLAGTLWRRRQVVGGGMSKLFGAGRRASRLSQAVPTAFSQYLLVWLVLLLLTLVSLLVLGWAIATGRTWHPGWQLGVPAAVLAVALCLDQTWMSLHPFYRYRLASAFAVRRWKEEDGETVARPYDFTKEPTKLSLYGEQREGFPQVIFAAAANLSGSDRTPPGRHAVSYTFSHDYVGGPDIGYVRTDRLEERTEGTIGADLTVQSAVAVSGAAFASAMGSQARVFQTLFALTNARLGTWVPNPASLTGLWAPDPDWRLPPQPRLRRLHYLLKEIAGRYPMDDRLLLTTDGGHYENLGLVELLRHGVRTAVCIDASGSNPPFAGTLADAISLAYQELGVRILLDDVEARQLVPGSARPLQPEDPLAALNARLSARAVVTGDIIYPHELVVNGQGCGTRGRLIVARAALTRKLPYPLLAYASTHGVFPNDATSDQWFDHKQFEAYRELGRFIGQEAAEVLRRLPPPPG
ncbi:patatin-like phospholipase family protein [Streptomyces sp. SCA3-4]|uniref:patatin-like phospholipase family protein n=1 Tax=Streptomyces sichuanensis TaxID=2871810 RepID=UPI001CE32D05|nr:patatin-like phospholipase family protein [Streptomyces sichuanensis]MCA6095773.1 patatin-like phospholipase family protein [Streptomyces sichuanensis]